MIAPGHDTRRKQDICLMNLPPKIIIIIIIIIIIVNAFVQRHKVVTSEALAGARFTTHVTCRLTAINRDQLRDPTLGNRVWATFTFYSPSY